MAISIEDLQVVAKIAREAADAAGELRPTQGPVRASVSAKVCIAVGQDLASGAYQRAAAEAVAGDPDLTQR